MQMKRNREALGQVGFSSGLKLTLKRLVLLASKEVLLFTMCQFVGVNSLAAWIRLPVFEEKVCGMDTRLSALVPYSGHWHLLLYLMKPCCLWLVRDVATDPRQGKGTAALSQKMCSQLH